MLKANCEVKLASLIEFFETHRALVNSHIGDLFTNDLWLMNVPNKIQEELSDSESLREFIDAYPRLVNKGECPRDFRTKYRNLTDFVSRANEMSVRRDASCVVSRSALKALAEGCDPSPYKSFEFKGFMSQKKMHEVKVVSEHVKMLMRITGASHVVDMGGGKGYLSSILALHNDCKVLGLDSSASTTCAASQHSQKIAHCWRGENFDTSIDDQSEEGSCRRDKYKGLITKNYKQHVEYVTSKTNVLDIVKEKFPEPCSGISLVGLHTCGNLAPTCLRIFLGNDNIKSLLSIGCCYQHVIVDCKNEESGFPMSQFLCKRNFEMGRNAMMLSQQSVDKYIGSIAHSNTERGERSLFYRSLLQVIIKERNLPKEGFVSRTGKRCCNFHDYMKKATKKLQLNIEISDEELMSIYEKYQEKWPLLKAYYLLRMNMAPVIESIILIDRLLYLLENGVEQAYLVPFFDLSISPRGFGIVAWKK